MDNQLQQKKSFQKWKERAHIGIYLGQSPQHNQSIALVLSRETGLVSPQFHIICDNNFTTTKDNKGSLHWMVKAGFVAQKRIIDEQQNQDPQTPAAITKTPQVHPSREMRRQTVPHESEKRSRIQMRIKSMQIKIKIKMRKNLLNDGPKRISHGTEQQPA